MESLIPPVKDVGIIFLYREAYTEFIQIFNKGNSYLMPYLRVKEWLLQVSHRKKHLVDIILDRLWNGIYIGLDVEEQIVTNVKLKDFPAYAKEQLENESVFFGVVGV